MTSPQKTARPADHLMALHEDWATDAPYDADRVVMGALPEIAALVRAVSEMKSSIHPDVFAAYHHLSAKLEKTDG